MISNELNILVVDDDPFVRDMLKAILDANNHKVQTAVDGKDGFGMIKASNKYDLVVSDMDMPEMTGLELIKAIRDEKLIIPIIILTGNNEINVAIEAMRNGANDYILKDENIQETIPFSVDNVMEIHRIKMQNLQLLEDLEEKNRQLECMAFLDGLTGIANRRYFDDFLSLEWNRARRDQTPITILLLDIDFFKIYNDTYGHQQGDSCLKSVATALNDSIYRSSDFVARYGGEEFVGILPNTDIEGGNIIAEKMLSNVAALDIAHAGSKAADHVTVSIGVGSTIPKRSMEAKEFIELVDKALYEAKQSGRNQYKTIQV